MNTATIIVAGLVALATVWAIVSQIRRKKQGMRSCGGNCSGCAMSGFCRMQDNKKDNKKD